MPYVNSIDSTLLSYQTANASDVDEIVINLKKFIPNIFQGVIDYTADSICVSSPTGSLPSSPSVTLRYWFDDKTTPIRKRTFWERASDLKNLSQTNPTIDCNKDQEYVKFTEGIHESPVS